uniref:Secreted protein n=1 Tax=Ascaris lumbricoides TaxID=6252 RepID=A0A0M3IEB4_ASCLU
MGNHHCALHLLALYCRRSHAISTDVQISSKLQGESQLKIWRARFISLPTPRCSLDCTPSANFEQLFYARQRGSTVQAHRVWTHL